MSRKRKSFMNKLSKKNQIKSVSNNRHNIQLINNPCYEVQLAAIQEKTNKLKYHFEYIKKCITYPDLLELLELKILACEE